MNRRQWLRKYPPPQPTPPGMCWRTIDGVTQLVSEREEQQNSIERMGKYDLYPREIRDQIKDRGRRA